MSPQRTVQVKEGRAAVTAAFSQPGTHVLRTMASDGALSSAVTDITVTVTP